MKTRLKKLLKPTYIRAKVRCTSWRERIDKTRIGRYFPVRLYAAAWRRWAGSPLGRYAEALRHYPSMKNLVFDLTVNSDDESFLRNLFLRLAQQTKEQYLANNWNNFIFVFPEQAWHQATAIFSLIHLYLPASSVHLLSSKEDLQAYRGFFTGPRGSLQPANELTSIAAGLNSLRGSQSPLQQPLIYSMWARNFLKNRGTKKVCVFIDFNSLNKTTDPDSFKNLVTELIQRCQKLLPDVHFIAEGFEPLGLRTCQNLTWLGQFGLSLFERIALAERCDAYIGALDVFAIAALNVEVPSVLFHDHVTLRESPRFETYEFYSPTLSNENLWAIFGAKLSSKLLLPILQDQPFHQALTQNLNFAQ